MATLVLQAAGAYLGGFLGTLGGTIGAAAGALGGYLIDTALINSTRRTEGPRLAGAKPTTAEEGAALPFVYGTARLSGTLIWATRFEEKATTTRQGGKGGAKTTNYSYFANAAYAIAEGEIAGIRRIWANGREIDQTTVEMRIYRGTGDQMPDPLIEAKQGEGNAPAYRGTAYVVFERMPIDDYGNRLPQIQFEVMRPVGNLARSITAVALIPGSTEFGLSPDVVTDQPKPGETRAINRNALRGPSDWTASMDELQALCPDLEHVALVVPWFGDDLRAGECRIRPGIVERNARRPSKDWRVDGLARSTAHLVSRNGEGAAYGGTPSDDSVTAAIRDAKARGLKVTVYPFIMMDIPGDNHLPSPYGGETQPVYPWRGRITCFPGPGQEGTADRTAAAAVQIAAFLDGEWGYRRLVRHCADLASSAGGVDAFIIGSELRGLTTLRDGANGFPFVSGLGELAAEIRSRLGNACKLTYAADWSEYFGHHPQDGSGDVFFHLDPLWAHPAIDAVGIDNYMPLSDWRDEDDRRFGPDKISGAYDGDGLIGSIAGGEGFDWYYASAEDRQNRVRSPISDGLAGKPWVFRYKDLKSWWENPHYNRIGGAESVAPTAWQPKSKPFWFTELGCPAVDKAANQPNVFPDPKSSENAIPYFSDGSRSDLAQSRFLGAHLDYWNRTENGGNPVSPLYGGTMLDSRRIYLWAWDTRPFPEFPLNGALWGDADNWRLGHWLNGRLSGVALDDLISAIFRDFGLDAPDTSAADGYLSGFVIGEPSTARSILDPLLGLFGIHAFEEEGRFVFRSASRLSPPCLLEDIVVPDDAVSITSVMEDRHDLPGAVEVFFSDPLRDYQTGSAVASRNEGKGQGIETLTLAGSMEAGQARALAEGWLARRWAERRTKNLVVPWDHVGLAVGDRIRLAHDISNTEFVVTSLEDGVARNIQAAAIAPHVRSPDVGTLPPVRPGNPSTNDGKPLFHLVDLPAWPGAENAAGQFRLACYARPWRGVSAHASPQADGYSARTLVGNRAIIGELTAPLLPGQSGRFANAQPVDVLLYSGELQSRSKAQLFNGANTALVQAPNGSWEVFQFLDAVEIAQNQWRLTCLLRGQLGTEEEASVPKATGTPFILLDEAVVPAGLQASEIGLALNWRIGTAGRDFSDIYFDTVEAVGGLRALQPLSPVHLAARQWANGDITASWIRRGRIDADSWFGAEIPLGEEQEIYQVEIRREGSLLRRVEAREPRWTYALVDRIADLGQPAEPFELAVAMVSARTGAGRFARLWVNSNLNPTQKGENE
ncbi:host specificity protein [Phyllobacterium salinisoli]|uniref:Host specificity protein n=1 Tax=Phyllobacterium salinisoli TaxID=1899321 RepID=A0A368K1L2_9HYPH|nr:glycoside hydrolase/phage tail family protein [Phyllobacterium salinisoli]RCS23278.1 host specificity protein [Phyllobacterium salinisoli]